MQMLRQQRLAHAASVHQADESVALDERGELARAKGLEPQALLKGRVRA